MMLEVLQTLGAFYAMTVLVEAPILIFGLGGRHALALRIFASFWLSAVTLPLIHGILPLLVDPTTHRVLNLAVAESFAPLAECVIFEQIVDSRRPAPLRARRRDRLVIVLANVASFLTGEVLR